MNQPDTHSRHYSSVDRLIVRIQQHFPPQTAPTAPSPAEEFQDEPLTPAEQRHSAGLMRVNHAGEVAAQGLYIGQAATARDDSTADLLRQAGRDELDHLRWCQERFLHRHCQRRPVCYYLQHCRNGIPVQLELQQAAAEAPACIRVECSLLNLHLQQAFAAANHVLAA